MTTMTQTQTSISLPREMQIYLMEARADLLGLLRSPGFVFPTLFFPLVFYFFFGVVFGRNGELDQATYLVATYGTFGIMGPCLTGFGLNLALERDRGWLRLKRVSPMPVTAYFTAKLSTSIIFSMFVVGMLFAMGYFAAGVSLQPTQWLFTAFVLLLGTLPFCALGLALGSWVSARSASAMVNLVYLPMALFSGLWMPIVFFPQFLKDIATVLPAYHVAELALMGVGLNDDAKPWLSLVVLLGQTVLFLAVARQGFKRISR